ncbi:hypothetical protein BJ875DRAFT_389672, partial [Amylocarpus encephaloides]
LEVDDVKHSTFGVFVNWLYTQQIVAGKVSGRSHLMDVWLLADRFMVPSLQNAALVSLDRLLTYRDWFTPAAIQLIYENSSTEGTLRQYLLDTWTKKEITDPDAYPNQFLGDLLNRTLSNSPFLKPAALSGDTL